MVAAPLVQDQPWFSLSEHGRYDDDDDVDDTCLKADVPRTSERSMRYTRLTNKLTLRSIRLKGDSLEQDCQLRQLSPVREILGICEV